jgi:hypothetical protein
MEHRLPACVPGSGLEIQVGTLLQLVRRDPSGAESIEISEKERRPGNTQSYDDRDCITKDIAASSQVNHEIFDHECDQIGRDNYPAPGVDRAKLPEYIGNNGVRTCSIRAETFSSPHRLASESLRDRFARAKKTPNPSADRMRVADTVLARSKMRGSDG